MEGKYVMKVLIIDDSRDALVLAKARLAENNLTIICSDSASAGLQIAKNQKPDLILLDVDMPEMSGFEVCKILKEDPELNMIPVVFLTGNTDRESKVTGLELGSVDYVTKPFNPTELRARVHAALRTKQLQDSLIDKGYVCPMNANTNRRSLTKRLGREWSRIQKEETFISLDPLADRNKQSMSVTEISIDVENLEQA